MTSKNIIHVNVDITKESIEEFIEESVDVYEVPSKLQLNGIFQGHEYELRFTPVKQICIFDFIKLVSEENPKKCWNNILDQRDQNEDCKFIIDNSNYFKFQKTTTPVINSKGFIKLLFCLKGDKIKQFIENSAEVMIRYLGGNTCEFRKLQKKYIQEQIEEIEEIPNLDVNLSPKLQFDGIFQGREKEIRITEDKRISVFDFIKVVGGQANPKQTWANIQKNHKEEIVQFLDYSKFGKTKATPVINVQGMVKLLFWLPGELAKQFRSKSAEVMIRYLGGDTSLIDEIKTIDQEHNVNPNNIAQVFRQEVNNNLQFNQDQINTSKKLINYYGNKRDIFYMFSFRYLEELYAKFGIVGELRDFYERVRQHMTEFENICFHNVIQCSNISKVESDFKETALFSMNKVKIPKKNGGNHTEVIKLSELITTNIIKDEMIKVAGERMIDPPPIYTQQIENDVSLEIVKEHTKQKQIEYNGLIKQKELELEIKKMEYEMMKLQYSITAKTNN